MANLYGTIFSTFHVKATRNLITEGGHTTSERQLFILLFFSFNFIKFISLVQMDDH